MKSLSSAGGLHPLHGMLARAWSTPSLMNKPNVMVARQMANGLNCLTGDVLRRKRSRLLFIDQVVMIFADLDCPFSTDLVIFLSAW